MNKLGGFFSRLRKPKHESSTEKFSVKHTEGITDSNILQSNEYNVQVDDVSNDSVILSNDSIEVSLVTESKGLPNNNNVEKRLTEEKEVLQSNDKKQVRTKESIERKGIKIVKILNKMNACKKVINVNEAKEVKNVTNDEILSDLLNQLYNNKNLIVTKVTAEDKSTNMDWNISENKIEDNIEHIQDKMKNKQTTEPIFPDLAKLLHTTNVKLANHTNLTTRIVDSMNSNECSKMQYINDQTTKCLKEFDKVLAEVQGNYNSDKAQALTLGIDDIILVKELDIDDILNIDDIFDNEDLNVDSTYYFQEIKHTTSNIDEKDLIVTGHTVQVGTTEIHSENTSKIETEDIDVISISSDDNNLNINENNSVTVEAVKNNGSENNEKEFNIILNSDKENEFLLQCNKSVKSKELKGSEQSKAFDKTKRVKVAKNSKVTCTEAIKSPKEINNSDQTKDSEEKVSQDIFDTISISSDEHLETISIGSSKHESDDCGYHSSDFEFISEGEAKKDGFIINFVIERQNLNKAKVGPNIRSSSTIQNDPYGPGPSRNSGNNFQNKAVKKIDKEKILFDENNQENHMMPQEQENMVNMFQASPAVPLNLLSENKSALARPNYAGLGFEMSEELHRLERDENFVFRDEAQETRNKILEMYPAENAGRELRKRRRR